MLLHGSIFCVLLLLLRGGLSLRAYNQEHHSNILNTMFVKNAYDNGVRPPTINGTGPVRVEVNMFVLSIPEVSEKSMVIRSSKYKRINNYSRHSSQDYTIQVYFRQSWLDPRLAFDDRAGDVEYVTLYDAEKIWKPDAFFSNEKEGHFHDVPRPNSLVRIFPTGRVLYSARLTLKLACPMNLKRYPFDTQSCSIIMPSYKYTTEDIVFAFKLHQPVEFYKDILVRNYKLTGHILGSCTSRTITGDYSCLRAEIWFQRMSHSLDVLVFIPCAIYTKAVDVWTSVTFAFVIALWIDVAVVELVVRRRLGAIDKVEPKVNYEIFEDSDGIELVENSKNNPRNGPARRIDQGSWKTTIRNWLKAPRSTADKVDLVSRIVFPVAFLLFVVIYIRNYAVKVDVPEEWL
ncbi:hypothetical protein MRX96_044444 [Rhipicephalus microplus]